MTSLEPGEIDELLYSYRYRARSSQLPPPGDWFVWLIRSGRGFGKTWVGSNWVIEWAEKEPQYPIALVGQTKADVRDTMIELGESSILNQAPHWFTPKYEPSKRRLTFKNGAICMIYSGDEPNQLRGPQHGKAWVDELAKYKYPVETWDNLELGLRLSPQPQACVTTTPRPIPIIKQLIADSDTVDVVGSTFENLMNLSNRFLERVAKKYEGTRLGRQELYGDILSDVPGALWTYDSIENNRITESQLPMLHRIVVAIDPAVTSGEESSETGIIVAGIADNSGITEGYVLEDVSLRGSPQEWANAAIQVYKKYNADRIIAETNNGGDMIEHTIRMVDRTVSFKQVRASRGKHTRAEPVAALYEQGKVHHIGGFPELEDQMCTWLPGDDSPDRMDALVWALTELMVHKRNQVWSG